MLSEAVQIYNQNLVVIVNEQEIFPRQQTAVTTSEISGREYHADLCGKPVSH